MDYLTSRFQRHQRCCRLPVATTGHSRTSPPGRPEPPEADGIMTVYTRSSELAQLRPGVAVSVTVEMLRTW